MITLLRILADGALKQGLMVRTSELHGLSQKGGTVQAHVRMGKEVHSPLIGAGKADLILSLELNEALRTLSFTGSETKVLVDDKVVSFEGGLNKKEIEKEFEKLDVEMKIIPASSKCKKELGNEIVAGVYLLAFASFKDIIPLKPDHLLKAVLENVPEKYQDLNEKAFNLAR